METVTVPETDSEREARKTMLVQRLRAGDDTVSDLVLLLLPTAHKVATRFIKQWPSKAKDILSESHLILVSTVTKAKARLVDDNIEKYVVATLFNELAIFLKHDHVFYIERRAWAAMAAKGETPEIQILPLEGAVEGEVEQLAVSQPHTFEEIVDTVTKDNDDLLVLGMSYAGYPIRAIAEMSGIDRNKVHRRLLAMRKRWIGVL